MAARVVYIMHLSKKLEILKNLFINSQTMTVDKYEMLDQLKFKYIKNPFVKLDKWKLEDFIDVGSNPKSGWKLFYTMLYRYKLNTISPLDLSASRETEDPQTVNEMKNIRVPVDYSKEQIAETSN
jgi:hypothetical protein